MPKWRLTTRIAVLFSDPNLQTRTRLHLETCRGRRCSCGGPSEVLRIGTTVERLEVREAEGSELVRAEGRRPVWVESACLGWGSAPKRPRESLSSLSSPDDFLKASLVLASGRLPPTRRRPAGGEVVLIRSEVREGHPRLWRFVGSVRLRGVYHLLLVDASVPPVRALDVGGAQVCLLPCDEERPQDVVRPILPRVS